MDKSDIIALFPKLKDDKYFKVSSPEDPNYNCIAWAYQLINNQWMQPPTGNVTLDAVTWWPDDVTGSEDIMCMVDAFIHNSYSICDSWEHEKGFIKVALYYNPMNNHWTHAARESRSGEYWMSKLGQQNDIYHGTPFTIEGEQYGKVYCCLKREDK